MSQYHPWQYFNDKKSIQRSKNDFSEELWDWIPVDVFARSQGNSLSAL
jgi:hypothetical protein